MRDDDRENVNRVRIYRPFVKQFLHSLRGTPNSGGFRTENLDTSQD